MPAGAAIMNRWKLGGELESRCSVGYCLNSVKKGLLIYTARAQAWKNAAVILLVAGGTAFDISVKQKWFSVRPRVFFFPLKSLNERIDCLVATKWERGFCMKFIQRKTAGVFYLFLCFWGEAEDWSSAVKVELSLSLHLSFGLSFELPAGSELFYALVVTGRFIRLEICTNQLSFTASCQCVKLSGLLWGAAWGREGDTWKV